MPVRERDGDLNENRFNKPFGMGRKCGTTNQFASVLENQSNCRSFRTITVVVSFVFLLLLTDDQI